MHVDMDSFFTACEARERPELKGKPVVVGADPKGGKGRGVVSTCSYEARKYGVHSGMPISVAYRKCPGCVFLPVNFELYEETSVRIMKILKEYADVFEIGGIDEAFLDVSSLGSFRDAEELAKTIKEKIKREEQLNCSIGVGPNKLVAKIASDHQKPDGLTVVTPSKVTDFLWPLGVRKIPGVGPKSEAVLNELEILTIGDLARLTKEQLQELFGKNGEALYDLSRGIDKSPVIEFYETRSIGREYTFQKDTDSVEEIKKAMVQFIAEIHNDLVEQKFRFKTVTLKIRYSGFETHTHSLTVKGATNDRKTLSDLSEELFQHFLPLKKKVRLIGVRVSNLESAGS
jgi:nucleotidyltransferase/DNA polymerase involved in DNA repair